MIAASPVRGGVRLVIRQYSLAVHLHRLVAYTEGLCRHLAPHGTTCLQVSIHFTCAKLQKRHNTRHTKYLYENDAQSTFAWGTYRNASITISGRTFLTQKTSAVGTDRCIPARQWRSQAYTCTPHNARKKEIATNNNSRKQRLQPNQLTSPSVWLTGTVTVATSNPSSLPLSNIAHSCIAAAVTTSLAPMK